MFQLQYIILAVQFIQLLTVWFQALLNTRGTGEPQGESSGFRTMNANVQRQLPGGKIVRCHT